MNGPRTWTTVLGNWRWERGMGWMGREGKEGKNWDNCNRITIKMIKKRKTSFKNTRVI